ncbi:unnamed protein product [Dovyalis caffra]|uniref:PDZ domain-containing protein n=1 Tax=Dovyalis caffra TaxID=77055 RepID=A0AAV1RSN3_9ROSI|nr:unnamed protein product [Dovyalis caffra]
MGFQRDLPLPPVKEAFSDDWADTINKVVPAVVVLQITTCRAFDTEVPSSGSATGFVVDKQRGIILTNRHVVGPGPVNAHAIFLSNEEIPVHPIYKDPVHDFGFFSYDPGAIKFLNYEEIPLAPEAVSVGLEIRVIGNDSSEKAASGTKPGSSGSPIINKQGQAVALNAGSSSSTMSAFYLPLERVVRALRLLQKCRDAYSNKWETVSIPRGTLQVTFHHKGFDEICRLGLQSETEQVPGCPAYSQLEPGDVLVCVNGEVTTEFLKLETLLDDNVDQKVGLQIERGGISYMLHRAGVPCNAIIKKFAGVEISQLEELISVFSKLSKGARVPLEYLRHDDRHRTKSVIVCIDRHEWYDAPKIYTRDDSSGLWVVRPAIQPKFLQLSSCCSDVEQGPKIESFSLSGESTLVKVMHQSNKQELANGVVRIEASNGHISKKARSREVYDVKTKECQAQGHLSSKEIVAANCSTHEIGEIKLKDPSTTEKTVLNGFEAATSAASLAESVIEPALVMLEVYVPPSCLLDGVNSVESSGTGVIIQHSQGMGLVAIDKNTVEISACDVMLSFAAFPIQIPGEVVFVHPIYNFALVAYDPSALGADGASMVHAAELLPGAFDYTEPALCRGDSVYLVGLSNNLRGQSRKSVVTNSCVALNLHQVDHPRYGATNMEVIELDSDFGCGFTGVLCDERGKVQALWGSFSLEDYQFVRGIPIYMISQIVDSILCGANGPSLLINGVKRQMPLIRTLEVSLYPVLLSEARNFGLSNDWIQALSEKDPIRRQVLRVEGCYAGSKAENLLKQNDMLLALNKEPVTCFRDIENACQALEKCGDSDGKLKITIFRQGCEVDLLVGTHVRDGTGTTRAISWCGCLVQDSHPAVCALGFLPEEGCGVYVAKCSLGSPADRYRLCDLKWIVQVNGKPTSDLDAFVNVVKELGPDEFVRVKTIDLDGKPHLLTLKQDLHYWPTWELRFDPDTAMWHRETIKSLECTALKLQGASGTRGGSSGSPVIDRQGRAVVRALRLLQEGRDAFTNEWEAVSIPRGTLQVTFLHEGFNETRRLGLQNETEQAPGGPAHRQLEIADVLVGVNGELSYAFNRIPLNLDSLQLL